MSTTQEDIFFAPLRTPVSDPRTGLMTRPWVLFFQALWLRSGGSLGPDYDDLILGSSGSDGGIGTAELQSQLTALAQTAQLLPANPMVAEMRSQLHELQKQVDALKVGTLI